MAIGTAAAIIGGSIIGGASSLIGSNRAAGAARDASEASVAENRRQFDLVRSDTTGQRFIGNAAVDRLARLYGYGSVPAGTPTQATPEIPDFNGGGRFGYLFGRATEQSRPPVTIDQGTGTVTPQGGPSDMSAFFESPDYQFNLAEGQKAIDRSLVARGRGLSGAGVREGTRYASGLASREYSAFVDRLMQQAGLGSTGIGQSAAAGANASSNISAAYQNAGNARASAYLTGAQGVNSAIQGGAGNLLLQRYLFGGGQPAAGFGPVGYGGGTGYIPGYGTVA